MPRKIKRKNVEIDYSQDGSLRAEDLPYDVTNDTKNEIISKTAPTVTVDDDGKLTQAYYDAPPSYGDESEGAATISSGGAGTELTYINDVTHMTADATIGATTINVSDATNFNAGDEIMLHQTQSWRDSSKRFQYCFRKIASKNGNELTLTVGLIKDFDSDAGVPTGFDTRTQVIRVPNYSTLTLNSGGGICARPWNGYSGGILAFRAKNLAGAGIISASDAGFRRTNVFTTQNADKSAKSEGPSGIAAVVNQSTWTPTATSEDHHALESDTGNSPGEYYGGSGYEGVNTYTNWGNAATNSYLSTKYTKDGVNAIEGVDLVDYLPMPIGWMDAGGHTSDIVSYGSGSPRNINTTGEGQAGGAIICFVQSHTGFTGAVRSRQTSGKPNGAGYVAFYAEAAFTGTTDVTTAPPYNGQSGDDGLFYSASPATDVLRGFAHGPSVATTDAGSAADDLLTRAAMDERYTPTSAIASDEAARTWQNLVLAKQTTPPGSPTTGDRYLVEATATDAWVGQEDKIAEWDGSAWVYTTPFEGMRVVNVATETIWQYYAAAWNDRTPVNRADGSLAGVAWFLDEDAMTSDDPTKVPSQQSVKAYVDNTVASAKSYQGGYDASTDTPSLDDGSPIAGISAGDVYDVTVAGNFFTIAVEVGDTLTAKQDSPTLEAHWVVTQTNLTAASIKTQYESNSDTNAFTDAEQTKLAGIEAGADVTDATNVNAVESDPVVGAINGLVKANGAGTIAAAVEDTDYQGVLAEGAFADGDKTKLDGIEAGADVTDATNVNAVESDPIVGAINGLVKANGAGTIAAAVEDTDYQGVLAEGAFADGDKTKLDGIASGADVTGSNAPQAHALAGSLHTVPAKTTSTPTGTTETIDWANGPLQALDLGSATGNVTLTLSNPAVGMRYTLLIVQGATSRNVVLPSTVLIPGGSAPNTITVTATDNAVDKLTLEWDGTNYHAELNQNYG